MSHVHQSYEEHMNIRCYDQICNTCLKLFDWYVGKFMVFNATFNNISAISWRLVLLVEETRVPGENH
jgi:hypothetical protein